MQESITTNFSNNNHERERRLQAYIAAVTSGDLEEQDRLLDRFQEDTAFVDAAWEIHVVLNEEAAVERRNAEASASAFREGQVRDLASATLTGLVVASRREAAEMLAAQIADGEIEELPPLSVRDVAMRLQNDVTEGRVPHAIQQYVRQAANRLLSLSDPLEPEHLTERGAETLLHRLGLAAIGNRIVGLFHEAALSLNLARQQDSIQLAAARRQRQARPRPLDQAIEQVTETDSSGEDSPDV